MFKKKKKDRLNRVFKSAAALVTMGAIALSSVPMTFAEPGSTITRSIASVSNSLTDNGQLRGPYQNSLNMASANYRNLNMTPGTTVNEMRWTWHSRSPEAGFSLFTNAIGTSAVTLTHGVNFMIDSRPLGSGVMSVLAADTWQNGGQTRVTGIGGGNATGMTHDYQWFTEETSGEYWVHQVIVTDLIPATNYWYQIRGVIPSGQVGAGSFSSELKPFFTGPGLNSGFTFTAGGDPQIGIFFANASATPGIGQKSHVEDYYGWTNAVTEMVRYTNRRFGGEHRPGFYMPVGDLNDTNDNRVRRSQFMHDILLAPTEFHSLPILPVIGNHETTTNGHLFHHHFNMPWRAEAGGTVMTNASSVLADFIANTPNTPGIPRIRPHGSQQNVTPGGGDPFTTNHGISRASANALANAGNSPWQFDYYTIYGNMLLIALDSNSRSWSAGRLEWVESIIAQYANQVTWVIATFHHPPYSVFRASNMGEKVPIIQQWLPELERLGVDMVLNGHCHVYSRTHHMLQNSPVLTQNWIQPDGRVVRGGADATSNVVLNPEGIAYIALNSMSGSGYRNVRNMGSRNYISVYNQNFRRNFSVIDVTNHSFAVHTYQVNDDGESVSLVDTYTMVKGNANAVALAQTADPWGLRQITDTTHVPEGVENGSQSKQPTDIINVETVPGVTSRIPAGDIAAMSDTALSAALRLPSRVRVELETSANQREEDAFGILGARALRDVPNIYASYTRPIYVDVVWDLSVVRAAVTEGSANGVFNLSGTLLTDSNVTSGLYTTAPIPSVVPAEHLVPGLAIEDAYIGRSVNWHGTDENMMLWRHGSLTNPAGLTADLELILGNAPLILENGVFTVAELSRTSFHYAHQPYILDGNNVRWQTTRLEGAFNRNVFETWPVVRSLTGFGQFRPGYHDIQGLITDTLPTIPPPGIQIKATGTDVLGNTPATNSQHTAAGIARPDAPNVPFHYFSRVFHLPADFNPQAVTDISGTHRIDDSMIMFINGVEVYRYNTHRVGMNVKIGAPFGLATGTLLAETVGFDRYIGANSRAINRSFNINSDYYGNSTGYMLNSDANVLAHDASSRSNFLAALKPSENIITIIVGDSAANSTDMWFDLGLTIGYDANFVCACTDTCCLCSVTVACVPGIAATCTNAQRCVNCQRIITSALGHNRGTVSAVTVAAACTADGAETFVCTRAECGVMLTVNTPMLGHTAVPDVSVTGSCWFEPFICERESCTHTVLAANPCNRVSCEDCQSVFQALSRVDIANFGDVWHFAGATSAEIHPDAFNRTTAGWATATTPAGFGTGNGVRLDGTVDNLGELSFTIATDTGLNIWTYFKQEFNLTAGQTANIADMDIFGSHRVDDALILFINGVEVYRYNVGPENDATQVSIGAPVAWNEFAGFDSDATTRGFTINTDYNNRITGFLSNHRVVNVQTALRDAASRENFNNAVRAGTNVITAIVGQSSFASNDLWFDLELTIADKGTPIDFVIDNPYANVDWESTGRYRTALHNHSTYSDGFVTREEVLLDFFNKGFDIVSMNDHNYLTVGWEVGESGYRGPSWFNFEGEWFMGATRANRPVSAAVAAGLRTGILPAGTVFPGAGGGRVYTSYDPESNTLTFTDGNPIPEWAVGSARKVRCSK
jgi:hypothetical protein